MQLAIQEMKRWLQHCFASMVPPLHVAPCTWQEALASVSGNEERNSQMAEGVGGCSSMWRDFRLRS